MLQVTAHYFFKYITLKDTGNVIFIIVVFIILYEISNFVLPYGLWITKYKILLSKTSWYSGRKRQILPSDRNNYAILKKILCSGLCYDLLFQINFYFKIACLTEKKFYGNTESAHTIHSQFPLLLYYSMVHLSQLMYQHWYIIFK